MERMFKDNNKKIIIGSSLSEVDLIIKDLVIKTKKPISNYEEFVVAKLATNLLEYTNKFNDYRFLNNDEAKALFYIFLKENIKGDFIFNLIPKESFSYQTSINAYETINKVRTGKIINQKHKLKDLINSFEKFLIDQKYLDEVLVLKEINKSLKENKDQIINKFKNNEEFPFYLLPSLKGKLSFIEKEFLFNLLGADTLDDYFINLKNEQQKIEETKVPTYGFLNEIKYIVKEIKEKKFNLDDVAIYASSNAYDNLIKGEFENNNINYYFENGTSILNENYTEFFFDVLDFISNHFNINYLYSLYKNPALGFYKDEQNNNHSYANTNALSKLKADKDQILKTIDNWKDSNKKQFINDLVYLFNDSDSIYKIYIRCLAFTDKYTSALSHRYAKEALYQKANLFKIFDSLNIDNYTEKINLIKNIVSGIAISKDPINEGSYVLINSINSKYLNRTINFFIGLSAKELKINEIESPLLSDDELKSIIDTKNYYVELAKSKNKELNDNLSSLLKTQSTGYRYFLTSVYDSKEFKLLSKSPFYLNSNAKEEDIFYTNNDLEIEYTKKEENYLFPQTEENIKKVRNLNLSPTNIETIMTCPLKYIYSSIYQDIDCDEFNNRWLKGGEEGNFAHSLLEQYFRNIKSNNFDQNLLNEKFNEISKETKIKSPFSNLKTMDYEANRVKQMVEKYLKRYYENKDLYKPIAFELDIKSDANNPKYNDIPEYQIHGKIDRVDAFVDSNNDLNIRIIDYKTYSKDSFKDHKNNNLLSQIVLYSILVCDYINNNISEVESLVGKKFNKKDNYHVEFKYELLKMNNSYGEGYDVIKAYLDSSLENYKQLIGNPTWDNFINTYEPVVSSGSDFAIGKCKYCHFSKYCKFKIQNGENKVWAWKNK